VREGTVDHVASSRACVHYVGLCLAMAVASATPLAAAQTSTAGAGLVVARAEGSQDCPDAAALAEQVRRIAGAKVISAELAEAPFETWVQVTITRNFSGYGALISTSGARHGSRTLEDVGPTCASLADAIAVTLAIILDPHANGPVPKKSECAPVPAQPTESKLEPPTKPLHSQSFFLDANAGATVNVLDHAVPFLAGDVGFRLTPAWSLSLGGGYVFSDTTASPGGEVELSLAYADLGACGRGFGRSDDVHLDWCLAAMLGSLRGSGRGYAAGFSRSAFWLAAAVGPQVSFPFTPSLSCVLTGEAVLPLSRNGFEVEYGGAKNLAFRPGGVSLLVSLGVRAAL